MKTSEDRNMFEKTKQCCSVTLRTLANARNAFCTLTMRQATIMIGIHQTVTCVFVLATLLVAIAHVGEVQSILRSDMEDDAERRGFYEVAGGEHLVFHEGDAASSRNQKRFASAKILASLTALILYWSTAAVLLYLCCCLALLHGAINRRRRFVLAWIAGACALTATAASAAAVGENYQFVINIFGTKRSYLIFVTLSLLAFVYGIVCVTVYAIEMSSADAHCLTGVSVHTADGERLLLLDRAAQSNLLSSKQIHKLANNNSVQFV